MSEKYPDTELQDAWAAAAEGYEADIERLIKEKTELVLLNAELVEALEGLLAKRRYEDATSIARAAVAKAKRRKPKEDEPFWSTATDAPYGMEG